MKAHIEQAVRQLAQAQKAVERVGTEAQKQGQRIANYLNKFAQYFGFFASMTDRAFRMMIEATPVLYGYTMEIRLEFERLAYSIGETLAPQFEALSNLISGVADYVENLPEPIRQVIGLILLFGQALGNVAPIIGGFGMLIGGLSNALPALAGAFGTTVTGLLAGFGVIAVAIIAIIAKLYLAKKAWDENWYGIGFTMSDVAYRIASAAAWIRYTVTGMVNELVHMIAMAQIKLKYLVDPVGAFWMEVAENVRYSTTLMSNNLQNYMDQVHNAYRWVAEHMETTLRPVYGWWAANAPTLEKMYGMGLLTVPSGGGGGGTSTTNITVSPNITVNANVSSDIDLRDLARKLADYYSDEISKKV